MIGYFFLAATVLAESLAIIFMKLSNENGNKIYLAGAILFYFSSFFLLNNALKYLPIGYTNAIWAGSSTVVVCMAGFFLFKEHFSALQLCFLACVIVGLVGLQFTGVGK